MKSTLPNHAPAFARGLEVLELLAQEDTELSSVLDKYVTVILNRSIKLRDARYG
jgi:hypothetical protein